MAALEFPAKESSPWISPAGELWVWNDGWIHTSTNKIYLEAKPDEAMHPEGKEWVRLTDLLTFTLYKGAWCELTSEFNEDGADGTDGVDGISAPGFLSTYVSDGIDGFVAGNFISHDGTAYVDTGMSAQGTPGINAGGALPIGTMFDFGGPTAPPGALPCNGQAVAETAYPELFAAIGTTWNTTGVAAPAAGNFRVPPQVLNSRGLFCRGVGEVGVGVHQGTKDIAHTHTANHGHSASGSFTINNESDHVHNMGFGAGPSGITNSSVASIGGQETTSIEGNHSHSIDGSFNTGTDSFRTNSSGSSPEAIPEAMTVLKCIWANG